MTPFAGDRFNGAEPISAKNAKLALAEGGGSLYISRSFIENHYATP